MEMRLRLAKIDVTKVLQIYNIFADMACYRFSTERKFRRSFLPILKDCVDLPRNQTADRIYYVAEMGHIFEPSASMIAYDENNQRSKNETNIAFLRGRDCIAGDSIS